MLLAPAFLDELRHRTTLSTLIGRTVKLQKAGREYKAPCPFHHEKTPSFYVNDDKGFYHCFGCSAHGDAIRWLTDQQGLPFIDAVKELAAAAGMALPAPDRLAAEKAERDTSLRGLVEQAAKWFAGQLAGVGGSGARAYLDRRGITPETAAAFQLGYAPDTRGRLREAFKAEGDARLIDAGLLISVEEKEPYDRFRGRLIIPIRDPRGRTIAFGGRVIGEGEPKYLNSPETALFDKGRTLFNLDKAAPAARAKGRIIVVEGYLDVIACAQGGVAEVVAPLGTALTEGQLELLWRQADVPILCFDGDKAGRKAAVRAAIRALPLLQAGRSLAFVTLPEGQDPDDLMRAGGASAFEAQLAKAEPLVELIWRHELDADPLLATPEARADLGKRLREHARAIRDDDVRTLYLADFNDRLRLLFESKRSGFQPKQEARRVAPELVEVSRIGMDQGIMAPALIAGLIRHPRLIAAHAETFGAMKLAYQNLRRLREVMLDAALGEPLLEAPRLDAILRADGLGEVLERLGRKTGLAFSFLRSNADAGRAERDLSAVIGVLAERADVEAALARATARLVEEPTEQAFAEQSRLRTLRERLEADLATMTAAGAAEELRD